MVSITDPRFFDQADIEREIRRVFDVCHTCRMCFSYCPSFPALFDAVDAHEERGEGEVDAMTAEEIDRVVDLCYQCKLCYVKCPYTPPHKFAVDFPRLLQRAKLAKVRRFGVRFRERVLGDPDRLARFSTGRVARFVNWANRQPLLRRLLERSLGIHRARRLPQFASTTFSRWLRSRRTQSDAAARVALFATCSIDYNYPQVGMAAVQVLEHNGITFETPDAACCGLPALDGGDLDGVRRAIERNVASLLPVVRSGKPVVVLAPSCGYMMKVEWPELHPAGDVREVSAAVLDLGELLAKEKAAGRLKTDFTVSQGRVAYHVPCHLRAQNVGQPFRAVFEAIADTTVEPIEQCSAFDGTWGMKSEYYALSRKCAGKLCRAVTSSGADRVASDCMLAGINVAEETGREPSHPIEIIRDAYGLDRP